MKKKKKVGRPTIDGKPQPLHLHIRMDEESIEKLDMLAKREKINRSEMVRKIIKEAK